MNPKDIIIASLQTFFILVIFIPIFIVALVVIATAAVLMAPLGAFRQCLVHLALRRALKGAKGS